MELSIQQLRLKIQQEEKKASRAKSPVERISRQFKSGKGVFRGM